MTQMSIQKAVEQILAWKDEAAYEIRKVKSRLDKLGDPGMLAARLEELEGKRLSFRRDTEARAATLHPFSYRVDVPIAAGSTARVPGSVTISQEGWFFCEKISCSWLASGTAHNATILNRWAPLSTSHPVTAAAAAAAVNAPSVSIINFWWEYVEGRAELGRQNLQIPGDVFYRSDDQCYHLPSEGDAFGPNSAVTFYATPTVAMGANLGGTLYFVMHGIQCRGVLKQ